MRIEIRGLGFRLTGPLLEHTRRRLGFALIRNAHGIGRVVVRLGHTSSPQGITGKFCKIDVVLNQAPPVRIEDAGIDLYEVIDRGVERAGRNVARRLNPLRENAGLAMPQGSRS